MPEITFRPYQIEDINFMTTRRRVLNANEPGLGKTIETLTARANLGGGSTLIVGPKSSVGVWHREAKKWYDEDATIYLGNQIQRRRIWDDFTHGKSQILITNYRLLEEVLAMRPKWVNVISDEAHLGGLLNHTTDTWKLFKQIKSENMFLLTGTPVRKGPQDMWSLLHLLFPKEFPSYWGFVKRHCITINNGFGNEIEGRPRDIVAFKTMLNKYMVRNLKKNVLLDLPEKERQAVPLVIEGKQLQIYNDIVDNMYAELPNGELIITPNIATMILRLRQLLVTPKLFGVDEKGALLETLPELVEAEFDSDRAVMVLTPFREAIPFIVEELKRLNCYIEVIHGQIKELPERVAQRFQAYPKKRKALICTIKAAISFDAYEASTGFMAGCEWGMEPNKQAEDRMHRIGQKNAVQLKYLLHNGTVDDLVMQKLESKQAAENWILSPEETLQHLRSIKR